MGRCFLCEEKLYGEQTQLCSSVIPHSNVPYLEKIAELLGEQFVIIVNPVDHMCEKCTSLLIQLDNLENDVKRVKNTLISYVQKKCGILPADQPVKIPGIVNAQIKTDELEVGKRKVPSGFTLGDNSVGSPLKMFKQQPNSGASKIETYKCGACSFQSKKIKHVRIHMRTHNMNEKTDGETKSNQTATKTLTPALQQHKQQQQQKK